MECVKFGHRLLFCQCCKERALPIDLNLPASVPELRRALAQAAPYGLGDALGYPFRNGWGWIFVLLWPVAALLRVYDWVPFFRRPAPWAALAGWLCSIVRATAAGSNEMPAWPSFADEEQWANDTCGLAVACALGLLPGLALGSFADWSHGGFTDATVVPMFLAGMPLGALLVLPAVALVAIGWSGWSVLRLDLLARILVACRMDGLRCAGLMAAVGLSDALVLWRMSAWPSLAIALGGALAVYSLFVGAHLVGLAVRRNEAAVEAILFVGLH